MMMPTMPDNGNTHPKNYEMYNQGSNARVNAGPPTGTSDHPGGRNALGGGAQWLHKNKTSEPSAEDPSPSAATVNQDTRGLSGEGDPTKLQSHDHRNVKQVVNNIKNTDQGEQRQDLPPQTGAVHNQVVNNTKNTDQGEQRQDLPPQTGAVHKNKIDEPKEQSEETGFPPDILGSQVIMPTFSNVEKPTEKSLVSESYDEMDTDSGKDRNKESNIQGYGPRVEGEKKEQPTKYKAPRKTNNKNSKKQQWIKFDEFNKMFGGEQDWQIYLIMTTETKMNISQIERSLLKIHPSEQMMVKRIYNQENKYLITTTSKEQSRTYLSITTFNGQNVTIEKHGEMNSVWGSVLIWDLEDNDETTYYEILKYRYKNVEEVKLTEIQRKNRKKLNILKIKFAGEKLPNKIYLEGTVKEVRPHVPRPNQCYKCLKYGHVSRFCKSESTRCFKCGSPDHDPRVITCPNPERCYNCNGEHHARSDKCEYYKYHTQVKHLQVRSGMTAREAKITLKAKGINDPYVKATYKRATINENSTR